MKPDNLRKQGANSAIESTDEGMNVLRSALVAGRFFAPEKGMIL